MLGVATIRKTRREVQMSARPRPTQSEFLEDKPSVGPPAIRLAELNNDRFPSGQPSLGNLDPLGRLGNLDPLGRLGRLEPLAFARYLIPFSIGVAVALAWQSYSNETREAALLKAISVDRDAVRQSLDRIATSVATSQEQMTRRMERSIDRLAADQEQTTREISDLQTFEQYVLDRISTLPPRSGPATAPKSAPKSPQASMVHSDIR
jgi:hypothetical protein